MGRAGVLGRVSMQRNERGRLTLSDSSFLYFLKAKSEGTQKKACPLFRDRRCILPPFSLRLLIVPAQDLDRLKKKSFCDRLGFPLLQGSPSLSESEVSSVRLEQEPVRGNPRERMAVMRRG